MSAQFDINTWTDDVIADLNATINRDLKPHMSLDTPILVAFTDSLGTLAEPESQFRRQRRSRRFLAEIRQLISDLRVLSSSIIQQIQESKNGDLSHIMIKYACLNPILCVTNSQLRAALADAAASGSIMWDIDTSSGVFVVFLFPEE